ncbi:hypothetical protein J4E85_007086 [Alternaria conjuncta]|uniref:uncharacterized protein n=1 Tax=Alternaria conjuncta TaxID=181017 RepID=UPI0022208D76|nr:uncharacterized protein J4E85_007086 [Alternaria conjuncta]KAI4925209.1 hypothetical protein J4E85_007086 [Alternaria conjuncta]
MASSRSNKTTTSASRNITGIVDKYTSPALGSSPPGYSRRSYDPILSGHGHGDVSTSPSPSLYPLSDSRRANLHQSTSTHSGYLDRAQLFGRTPIQHQRNRSSRTPTGEWAEAGLPEPPIEASRVSADNAEGLVCTPGGITTMGVEEDTPGRFSPKAKERIGRKTETAEDALREQFEKGRVELARDLARRSSSKREAKWAGRGFDARRGGYVSPKTLSVASDDEEEEFGYVVPASVRDVLARVKAREAAGRTQSPFDGSQRKRDGGRPRESYSDVGVPRRSKNALLANPSDPDKPLPKLPNRRVFSLVEPPPMKKPTRKRLSRASNRTDLSFSPITPAINVAPQPTRQDLDITPVSTYLSFSSFSSVTTTISQPPTLPHNRTGLTFSQAIAIIYGCMAITASYQALLGLGGDIAAMDLITGLYRAFLLGITVCVALQVLLGAGL